MNSAQTPRGLGFSYTLCLVSVVVGVIAGVGAVLFRGMIALFHNLLFLGTLSFRYDANQHTPIGHWGAWIILVPVLGAVGVVYLVKNFAPEAKGHGVPEVIDATYYRKGIIRPVVAAIKSVASAISIGSGGSIGREGPIIQIGASFGSTVGQILPMPPWKRITLIAAGAGGGIAATFNTPVGGILFAIEIMMHEISVRTLVPVGIATVTATYIGRLVFGPNPSFVIPEFASSAFHTTNLVALLTFVGLGVLAGLVSALFIKSLYGFEDLFNKWIPGSYYARHLTGMLLVGITIWACMVAFGRYYVQGVGYATVQDILQGGLSVVWLLALLFVLKLLVTSLTLGSGASGGIFSPGLFMGATMGAIYGIALEQVLPGLGIGGPGYAVAGMAGVIGGSTGAAMAGIVMIFEMTRDYSVIIPMTITVVIAYAVRRSFTDQSIYTLKLARRGHLVPSAMQANFFYLQRARDAMSTNVVCVSPSTPFRSFLEHARRADPEAHFVVGGPDHVFGIISKDVALGAAAGRESATSLAEITDRNYILVGEDDGFFDVISQMHLAGVPMALVTANAPAGRTGMVLGIITREQIADSLEGAVDLFADWDASDDGKPEPEAEGRSAAERAGAGG